MKNTLLLSLEYYHMYKYMHILCVNVSVWALVFMRSSIVYLVCVTENYDVAK